MSAFFTQKAPGRKNKENLNAKLFIQIVLILAICLGGVGKGWGQILTFEFLGLNGNDTTANSNFNDINLSSSTISRGVGLTAAGNGDRFNATNWAATSIANAVSGNHYMEFTITPNTGFQFSVNSIVIYLQRSATGPRGIALRSSVDGYTSNLDAVKTINDNTITQSFNFNFTQTNSNVAVTYRMYMYAEAGTGSGGPGDNDGNDIIVNGTVTPDGPASPEINVKGNNTDIASGDITPSTTDHTDFGFTCISGGTIPRTFTIENVGTADLTLTGASPYVTISGANASEFSIVTTPTSTIAGGTSTTFNVLFNPTATGIRTATISIANDDATGSEDPYTFGISGTCIDIPAQPGTITGPTSGCGSEEVQYSISSLAGATSYNWSFPIGWTIVSGETTETVTVIQGTASGNATVIATNACGDSPEQTLAITMASAISAPNATAAGAVSTTSFTANWDPVAGATGYYVDVYTGSVASDLFISEYVEGSFNNKYIEIFNGTGVDVDLSDYRLLSFVNGSTTASLPLNLSGTLANGNTFVIGGDDATIYSPDLSTSSTVLTFNGDDALVLMNSSNDTIDIFGTIGEDPGSAWSWGTLSTLNKTLVRKSSVSGGITTNPATGFPTLETEWDVYNIDDVIHLGTHTFSGGLSYVPGYQNLNTTATSILVTGLTPGTTYYYVVRADNGTCTSVNSNQIVYTTPACVATHTLSSFNPAEGPVGTWVTIFGSGFTNVTDVLFNGIAATSFIVVDQNTIRAQTPVDISTGTIRVINDGCGLETGTPFVLKMNNGKCGGGSGVSSDLFISEVYDASAGSLAYIELYNGTNATIALTNNYKIVYQTGGTITIPLVGNILPGATFILRTGTGTICSGVTSNQYASVSGFNADDEIELMHGAVVIDRANTPGYAGYSLLRRTTATTLPSATYIPADWTVNTTESCSNLGTADFIAPAKVEVTLQPADVNCNSSLTFTVNATATAPEVISTYVWKFNDPATMNSWGNVSELPSTYNLPVTVSTPGLNTITITGATSVLQNFQFYVEIKTAGSPQCVQASNVAQYSFESKAIYQSKANGDWTNLNTWQMSDNISGPWMDVCNYPNAATSDRVIIKNNVILDTDNKVDWLIVESGGSLEVSDDSQLAILNGNSGGADLQVLGTYIDRANTSNSIQFEDPAATWELGAAGSFIKTNSSGVVPFRNNYQGSIVNIPATANWIYRRNGDGNPAVISAGMVYPNLIFENTTGSHFNFDNANMILNGGIAAASYCRVKGDFRVGVTGSSSVTVYNNNISVNPMLVEGDIEVGVGSTLTNASFDGNVTSTYGHGTGYILHGHLTVNGNFINDANQTGILSLADSSDQIISGSGTMALEDVEINNTGGAVQVRKSFSIPGTLSFGSTAARLNVDTSDITLQSNFDRTANVGIIPGTNQISYGSGRFVVERFVNTGNIDIGKSWQFLSTPTTGQTVRQSWQEDGDEPTGYGTWIVGPAGTGAGYDDQNTLTSLKSFDAGIQNWVSKDATNNALLEPRGYMVFIRGDRSAKLFSSPVTSTTLRSRGTLFAPGIYAPYTIPVSVANNFYAAGNPYASAISVTEFVNVNIGINDGIKVWDPTLNGSYGLGGYQTITKTSGNLSTPGGTLYYPSGDQKDIQSGNAFLIDAPGPASVSFTENMKVNENELLNKGPQIEQNIPMLSSMLFNAAGNIADGNRVVFDDQYTDDIDRWDARKYLNSGENFGLLRNGMSLVVEARSSVKSTDTLFYRMSNLTQGNYELRFGVQHIANPEGLQGILIDKFLQTETIIPLSDSSFVPFQTNSNAASRAADRFMLVFSKPAAPLPVRFVSIGANRVGNPAVQVHWKIELEEDMEDYGVEHSINGTTFTEIGHVAPAAASQYRFLHSQADAGQNFYRIRAISQNGLIQYSPVAAVQPLPQAPGFSVYPNPLAGSDFQLNLQDIRPGKYHLQLINDIGQTVQQQEITISSANQIIPIRLQQKLAKGVYQLLLWNGEENRRGQVVVVN